MGLLGAMIGMTMLKKVRTTNNKFCGVIPCQKRKVSVRKKSSYNKVLKIPCKYKYKTKSKKNMLLRY